MLIPPYRPQNEIKYEMDKMKPLEEIIRENKEADKLGKTDKLKKIEQFADLTEEMYHMDIITPKEYNILVELANKLQYQKELTVDQETLVIEGDKDK